MDDLLDALEALANADPSDARAIANDLDLDVAEDASADEILGAALQKRASNVWHSIQNDGFAKARDKWKTRYEEAQEELNQVRDEKEDLESEVEELRKENPDVEQIRADAREEVEKWKQRAKDAEEEARERINSFQVERKVSKLESMLKDAFSRDRLAEAEAQLHRDRFQPKEDGEGVEVLQPGSEIPFTPEDGQDATELLAEKIISSADPQDLASEVDNGGGESGSGGVNRSGMDSRFEQAAKEGAEQGKKESSEGGSLDAIAG